MWHVESSVDEEKNYADSTSTDHSSTKNPTSANCHLYIPNSLAKRHQQRERERERAHSSNRSSCKFVPFDWPLRKVSVPWFAARNRSFLFYYFPPRVQPTCATYWPWARRRRHNETWRPFLQLIPRDKLDSEYLSIDLRIFAYIKRNFLIKSTKFHRIRRLWNF